MSNRGRKSVGELRAELRAGNCAAAAARAHHERQHGDGLAQPGVVGEDAAAQLAKPPARRVLGRRHVAEAAQLVRLQPAAVLGAKRRAEEAEVAEGGRAVDEAAERAAGAAEADELGARQQEVRDDELDVGDGQHLGEQVDAMRCGRGRRRVGDAWDAIVLKRLVVLVVGGRPRRYEPHARRQLVRRAECCPHLGEQRTLRRLVAWRWPRLRRRVGATTAIRVDVVDCGEGGVAVEHGANSCGRRTQRARTSLADVSLR